MSIWRFARPLLAAGLILLGQSAFGQGRSDYFNVESPQVHPIEVATIDQRDYLLAVNTPDNSLEVWSTDEALPVADRFLMRLPVGLEPVSVRWVPALERAYVTNFLGDSVTAISLSSDPVELVRPTMVGTVQVTDAPLDLVHTQISTEDGTLRDIVIVTHMTLDAISKLDAQSLRPIAPGTERLDAVVPSGLDLDFDGQLDDIALKEPRTGEIFCDKLFVIGHKGGNTERYDFDVYSEDLQSGAVAALGGLGSQNNNLTFDADGNLLVVGAMALNDLRDEDQVAAAKTGFVKSMFYLVENPCSDSPTIHSRDVNLQRARVQVGQPVPIIGLGDGGRIGNDTPPVGMPTPGGLPGITPGIAPDIIAVPKNQPVPKGKALAYLTDVLAFGAESKVFFTAFGSDRVGVIEPDPNKNPLDWALRRIDVTPVTASMAGVRGLALRTGANPRLYVLNRIDNSVTVIDASAETVIESFALNAQPTPDYITEGRRFLYDAKLSGNGFVSCSSCHYDARTDGLAWDLGDGNAASIPPEIMPNPNFNGGLFDADKEFMVTQSLEGLLNYEVEQANQKLFTNAPYHWRGDRVDFPAFNGAFVSLLGGDPLSDDNMLAFEQFINSIHYAPNPKQPRARVPSGELGDPNDNDLTGDVDGDGAMLGLKLYHIANSDGFSCVGCHTLPEGSDNVLTENIAGANPHPLSDPPVLAQNKVMETAALRLLFQKEARLDRDGFSILEDSPITGYEGMMHTGLTPASISANFNGTASLNGFNTNFFTGGRFCPPGVQYCKNIQALMEFIHQFDTGTAPMVGRAINITLDNIASPEIISAVDDLQRQADVANAGIAAHVWNAANMRGFWYDLSVSPPVFREEGGTSALDRAALFALVQGTRDRLILHGVPLGSERRFAHPNGTPAVLTGPTPGTIRLQPMVPNTGYARVPELTLFWDNANATFNGTTGHTVRLYQFGLINDAPNGYGLCTIRHEAPRRFRVSGKGIRHGAQLHLYVHDDEAAPGPPDTALGPEDPAQVAMLKLTLPLHASATRGDDGEVYWETAVELEPLLFYRLMAGRPDQTQFPNTMVNLTDRDHLFNIANENTPGLFNPPAWNQHFVRVVNADGSQMDAGWQSLSIEPGPLCP